MRLAVIAASSVCHRHMFGMGSRDAVTVRPKTVLVSEINAQGSPAALDAISGPGGGAEAGAVSEPLDVPSPHPAAAIVKMAAAQIPFTAASQLAGPSTSPYLTA